MYTCMDSIGEEAHACAGRWKSVLEELLIGFSHKIKFLGMLIENPRNERKDGLGKLFSAGRVIEANNGAEEIVNVFYPDMKARVV